MSTNQVEIPKEAINVMNYSMGEFSPGDGAELNEGFARAARNIENLDVLPSQGANVYDILRRDQLVLTKAAVAALEERLK